MSLSLDSYRRMDATALAAALMRGDLSPACAAALAAEACTAINPVINGVIELFDDVIDDPARGGMNVAGPFAGVPMLVKDLGSRMRGRLQESGFSWRQQVVSDRDDPFIACLRRAGFNLVGRTTTPEDGMAIVTESIKFGATRNPWNPARSSGGSSGGSAAAVASGIVPAATASDGGGSIRAPAAWNGLVGLKSTRGRHPLPEGVHEAVIPSAVEGVLTRSVCDTAAVYDLLTQGRPLGSGFMPYPDGEPLVTALDETPGKFRVALSTDPWSRGGQLPGEILEALAGVAQWLEREGHTVEIVAGGDICDFSALFAAYRVANWVAPIGSALAGAAESLKVDLHEGNTSRQALLLMEEAKAIDLEDYLNAIAVNAELTRQWGRFWERGYDLLLTPTMAEACPPVNSEQLALSSPLSFDEHFNHFLDMCRYTVPGNEVGLPAISVPAGFDVNGCPVGVQFYAPWTRERDLIQVAAQLEQGHGDYFCATPPIGDGVEGSQV